MAESEAQLSQLLRCPLECFLAENNILHKEGMVDEINMLLVENTILGKEGMPTGSVRVG